MKKCAIINDLSGFGKCSLGVAIPIISVMGIEVHPIPTAILTNQTAYSCYSSHSMSDFMGEYITQWKRLGASFDSILTGFFNDISQIECAHAFIDEFKKEDTILVVDPVMADNGSLYDGVTDEMCKRIIDLCYRADIITPNLAELAFIAGEEPSGSLDDIINYGNKLLERGIKKIVATGYKRDGNISNIVFGEGEISIISAVESGGYYSGTGDILSSIITASVTNGNSLFDAVDLATGFIEKAISVTDTLNHNEGINFEECLGDLADER